MAAYASLVSLMHTIEQIRLHPRPPIPLDEIQVESITENITFLKEFLESYSMQFGYGKEADPLEMRIADAAYAAEDVIESHIVDQILARHTGEKINSAFDFQMLPRSSSRDEKISSNIASQSLPGSTARNETISSTHHEYEFNPTDDEDDFSHPGHADEVSPTDQFYHSLQQVTETMDSLKNEVMEIKEKIGVRDQLLRSSTAAGSIRSSSSGQNATMVGFDGDLVEIMDKLTGGQRDRQIIPIVGMGGTGKTTLARNVYQNQVVVQHFDILVWVTISQQYKMREILLELLQEGGEDLAKVNEHELGDKLHKKLSGRRYLIVMDDVCDIEVWYQLRWFFPDNNNGSRIVMTTRISIFLLSESYVHKMEFLDKDKSWTLFSKIVFGEEGCPLELEEVGKAIVDNCRGLPLSIVVVGGLLAKSEHSQVYWEYIAENLNSIVNSEDDERCLKILHISYNQLPVCLKPCFLYMGVFREDMKIRVSELIKLWVAQGFLKPICGKSLEEVANKYLKELINRNLVLVHKLGCTGNIKYCKIHDLLRDLSLRQAEKERFYNVIRQHNPNVPQDTSTQRRIVIPEHISKDEVGNALQIMRHARSWLCDSTALLPWQNSRLLRIMSCPYFPSSNFRKDKFNMVNSRCLFFKSYPASGFPSPFPPLWNLQTLIVGITSGSGTAEPFEIWKMPQLRHLKFRTGVELADLPSGGKNDIVLGNLQTLGSLRNFKYCEDVVKRIPNVKKLKVWYKERKRSKEGPLHYSVNNFSHLTKLESFLCSRIECKGLDSLQNLTFPHSLKKLTLEIFSYWEEMLEYVGSLPLLEKFKLKFGYFKGRKWDTVEGQFPSLKCLQIEQCHDFEYWTTESSHFPCLEHLLLIELIDLKEFPLEIGEIPTLKSVMLRWCRNSVLFTAKKAVEEQVELYGEVALQVRVRPNVLEDGEELRRLASPNFQFL